MDEKTKRFDSPLISDTVCLCVFLRDCQVYRFINYQLRGLQRKLLTRNLVIMKKKEIF